MLPDGIKNSLPQLFFFLLLGLFVLAAVNNLVEYFPYESFDEYYKFRVALELIQIFSGQADCAGLLTLPVDSSAPFLMYTNYIGWPALYIATAVIAVLGKSFGAFFVFRLTGVLFAVITLCSIWFVLKRWFDEWTAALAVFFVGANYSYIQPVQHAFYRGEIFQLCGFWSGLALCLSGIRLKRKGFLYFGFFVFGITLWAKIMFVAYIIGAVAVFIVWGRERWALIKSVFPSLRSVFFAGMSFLFGALPFLWFNLNCGFPTGKLMLSCVSGFSKVNHGWNNSAVLENLMRRFHDFYLYLGRDVLFGVEDGLFKVVYLALFACAFVWGCLIVLGFLGKAEERRRLCGLFVFYAVVLFLTCFVPSKHNSGHVLMLVPFCAVLSALFLTNVARLRGLLFIPVLVCGLWLGEQLNHMYVFSRDYIQCGKMHGLLKGEPEELTAWLKAKGIDRILCSDPVGYVLSSMNSKLDIDFYDMGYCPSEPEVIAEKIDFFISESPGPDAYMLVCSGAKFDYFAKVKNSAAQSGINLKIIDIKTFRRKPTYAYVLCRVNKTGIRT